jgi:NAD(P) transhydrogenase subunit alpha
MKIGALKEISLGERRVALTPDSAIKLLKLSHDCLIEAGAGIAAGFSDEQYKSVGVEIINTSKELTEVSDVIVKVLPPSDSEIKRLSSSKTLISFFYPSANEVLMELAKSKEASVIAMDMVPRISRAQKMDALSSMANISGYRAVIEAGNNFGRFFTGQMTAAGKVPPLPHLVLSPMHLMCAQKLPSK